MKLEIYEDEIHIVPENSPSDKRDTAYIENVLGLKKDGDWMLLTRKNAHGLLSLGYLKTEKNPSSE